MPQKNQTPQQLDRLNQINMTQDVPIPPNTTQADGKDIQFYPNTLK